MPRADGAAIQRTPCASCQLARAPASKSAAPVDGLVAIGPFARKPLSNRNTLPPPAATTMSLSFDANTSGDAPNFAPGTVDRAFQLQRLRLERDDRVRQRRRAVRRRDVDGAVAAERGAAGAGNRRALDLERRHRLLRAREIHRPDRRPAGCRSRASSRHRRPPRRRPRSRRSGPSRACSPAGTAPAACCPTRSARSARAGSRRCRPRRRRRRRARTGRRAASAATARPACAGAARQSARRLTGGRRRRSGHRARRRAGRRRAARPAARGARRHAPARPSPA